MPIFSIILMINSPTTEMISRNRINHECAGVKPPVYPVRLVYFKKTTHTVANNYQCIHYGIPQQNMFELELVKKLPPNCGN